MTPENLLHDVIEPAFDYLQTVLSGGPSTGADAQVLVLAIAGQEGAFRYRRQNGGPARSYWQFESGGGVAGVMGYPSTGPMLSKLCAALDIPYNRSDVFEAMAWSDRLGCAMARMLLYTDAAALPKVGDQEAAWSYYLRNWRPGKPDHGRWAGNYQAAMKAVLSSAPDVAPTAAAVASATATVKPDDTAPDNPADKA